MASSSAPPAGSPSNGRLVAAYTWLDSEVREVEHAEPRSATASPTCRSIAARCGRPIICRQGFELGGGVRYVGTRYTNVCQRPAGRRLLAGRLRPWPMTFGASHASPQRLQPVRRAIYRPGRRRPFRSGPGAIGGGDFGLPAVGCGVHAGRDPCHLDPRSGGAGAPPARGRRSGRMAGPPPARNRRSPKAIGSCPMTAPAAARSAQTILAALSATRLFMSAALPKAIFPPLFNRYEAAEGHGFGNHVDNADPLPSRRQRTDPHRSFGDAFPVRSRTTMMAANWSIEDSLRRRTRSSCRPAT